MEKSHRHRRKPTGLSRTQIEDICIELKGKYSFGHDDIIKTVSKILVDDITMQDEDCQHVVGLFLTPDIIDKCGAKFIELYRQCYTGGIKDRYALLQISWSEWACACLIGDTPENIAMIPDEISSRQYDEQESCAVRAVFHAICSAFFEATSLIVKDIRPLGTEVPSVHAPHHYEKTDTILGFAGACMRLVYRKSDYETKMLINKLQMTETMKRYYTECGVLARGTSSHRTLPVRGLNQYLKFLNKCIAESCTTQALHLYGKDFVKVCWSQKSW